MTKIMERFLFDESQLINIFPEQLNKELFSQVEFRVVRTRTELEKAYSLVYKEYLKKGFTSENPYGLRFSFYNALPETTTLIAIRDNSEILATATIISDSALGLPMNDIFETELAQLRGDGKKICEITMLAVDTDFFKHNFPALPFSSSLYIFSFFKVIFDYVQYIIGFDIMCAAVHPHRKNIFDHLLFQDFGTEKSYYNANGAPAIAKYLDVHSVAERFSKPGKERLYKIFVLQQTNVSQFEEPLRFTLGDLLYFFAVKSDILSTLSPSKLEYIKSCYPALILTSFLNYN